MKSNATQTSNSSSSSSHSSKRPPNAKSPPVELGYIDETDWWRLESHFFPSKVGGKPAWLSFQQIPTPDAIRCGVCGELCTFLLQVYAPVETVAVSAFHRTLFVFVCRNPSCCIANKAENFVVLRCQLPKENDFYSSTPINIDEIDSAATKGDEHAPIPSSILEARKRQEDHTQKKLCAVCSCPADKQCAQCKDVYYCTKSHQEADWKSGGHKGTCGKSIPNGANERGKRNPPLAFPEMELITETEHYVERKSKERPEGDRLQAYEEFVRQQQQQHGNQSGGGGVVNGMNDESVQHLEAMAKAADKDFKLFRRRLDQNPEQVLRYQRSGEPLWVNRTKNTPQHEEIPACQLCGAPRVFEFQIMPHLLSYLDVDSLENSLDWATVAIYTCRDSCDIPEYGYTREWIWKQDFVE